MWSFGTPIPSLFSFPLLSSSPFCFHTKELLLKGIGDNEKKMYLSAQLADLKITACKETQLQLAQKKGGRSTRVANTFQWRMVSFWYDVES
jgi:hypothetical protein